jgi:hypothetical protein
MIRKQGVSSQPQWLPTTASGTRSLGGGLILAEPGPTRLIYSVALTIALIAIVVWKGERPAKWRWRRRQTP